MAERVAPCDLGEAAATISAFQLLCDTNTNRFDADSDDMLTPFHSVAEPPISLAGYVERFMRYLSCTDHGVILGVVIACRYCQRSRLLPSRLTAHRLVITGIVIAVKCHHDRFSTNKNFARVGGIPLAELNALELIMFHGIGYRTRIEQAQFSAATHGAATAMRLAQPSLRKASRDCQSAAPRASGVPLEVLRWAFGFPCDNALVSRGMRECPSAEASAEGVLPSFGVASADEPGPAAPTKQPPPAPRLAASDWYSGVDESTSSESPDQGSLISSNSESPRVGQPTLET